MLIVEMVEKLKMLEYHQKLLLKMVEGTRQKFDYLMIEKSLSQSEVDDLLQLCEKMSKELQKQKAEGFVNFHPLFSKFNSVLTIKLETQEVITACLEQGLYVPLMLEMKKYSQL